MNLTFAGPDLVVLWDASKGGKLEFAPAVTGPWTEATGPDLSNGRYTVPSIASGAMFYRLKN